MGGQRKVRMVLNDMIRKLGGTVTGMAQSIYTDNLVTVNGKCSNYGGM
jgi:hypothetical protein